MCARTHIQVYMLTPEDSSVELVLFIRAPGIQLKPSSLHGKHFRKDEPSSSPIFPS